MSAPTTDRPAYDVTGDDVEAAMAARGETEPAGPPTQATALRAAAVLTGRIPPVVSVSVDAVGCVRVTPRSGPEALATMADAGRYLLREPRRLQVYDGTGHPGDGRWHVWLSGSVPGTAGVEFAALTVDEPIEDDLAELRALCGGDERGGD